MRLCCYDIADIGAEGAISERARALCKKHYACMYQGSGKTCFDICLFSVRTFHEYYKDGDKNKPALRLYREVSQKAVAKFRKFYNIEGNGTKELKDYTGFNPLLVRDGENRTEIERFLNFFKLPTIQIWEDDEKRNIFTPSFAYKCKKHKILGVEYKDKMIDLVCYPSRDEIYKEHFVYIIDLEKALRITVCPKCKYYVFHKNARGYDTDSCKKHIKECDGKRPVKQLNVSGKELPYAPGMWTNKTYLHLQGNNLMHEWKP
jgi:hypothetical protein